MTHSQNPAEEQNELALRSTVHWLRYSWAIDYPHCNTSPDFAAAMCETADEVERAQAEIHRLQAEIVRLEKRLERYEPKEVWTSGSERRK